MMAARTGQTLRSSTGVVLMRTRLASWAAVIVTVAATVTFSGATPADAVTPVRALTTIAPVRLVDTRTGIGAPAGRVRPHAWTSVAVPAGQLTSPGISMVVSLAATNATAPGNLGIYPWRTATAPAATTVFTAGRQASAAAVTHPSTAGTIWVYNNSSGYVNIIATAIGIVRASPTESFHRSAVTVLDTRVGRGEPAPRAIPPHAWLTFAATAGLPATATSEILDVTTYPGTFGGTATVMTNRTASAPSGADVRFTPGVPATSTLIRNLGAGGTLSLYNNSSGPLQASVTVAGYVIPTVSPPSVPTVSGLQSTSTMGRVVLNWSNPAGTTGVVVRRATGAVAPATPSSGTSIPTTGAATTVTDNSVLGGAYSYAVFAQTGAGMSAPATVQRAGPPVPVPGPGTTVIGPGFSQSPGEIHFNWTQTGTVDHYVISLSHNGGTYVPAPGNEPTGIVLPGTARTYDATGLVGRDRYDLTVYALDAAGNFQNDMLIVGVAGSGTDAAPAPVSAATATATPTAVTVGWTNPANQYIVAISRLDGTAGPSSPTTGTVIAAEVNGESSFTDTTALPGHTYTYSVFAYDPYSSAPYGTPVAATATTPTGSPPAPVSGLTATPLPPSPTSVGQSITLTWSASPGAVGYYVGRSTGTTSTTPPAPTSPYDRGAWRLASDLTSFTDTGLIGSIHTTYAVWAIGSDGSISSSTTVSAVADPGAPHTVSGTVTNAATNAPIAGAKLTFTQDSATAPAGYHPTVVTSAADGSYSVPLTVAVYQVCVGAADVSQTAGGAKYGYFNTCHALTVTATTSTYAVPVDPRGAVIGTITDSVTGQPIAGVQVWTYDPTYQSLNPQPRLTATSAADGTYTLAGLKPMNTPTVYAADASIAGGAVYGTGYASATSSAIPAGGSGTLNFSFTPLPIVTVSGTVTSAADGSPVAGATVDVIDPVGHMPVPKVTTAADGTYAAKVGLMPGDTLRVCVDAESARTGFSNLCFGGADFDPGPLAINGTATAIGGTQSAVDLALQPESTITGTVVGSGGAPIAGAQITGYVTGRQDHILATTDVTGTYVLRTPINASTGIQVGICADATGVTDAASPQGYLSIGPCTQSASPSVAAPSVTVPAYTAPFASAVSGTVTDAITGTPLGGVHLYVTQYGNSTAHTAVTDSAGRYTVAGLDPSDYYPGAGICFQPYDNGPTHYNGQCIATPDHVATEYPLTTHQTATGNWAMTLPASAVGTVTAADTGLPMAGVTVNLAGQTTTTDSGGHYLLTNLPTWSWNVANAAAVDHPGFGYLTGSSAGVSLDPNARATADIVMQPAGALIMHLLGPDGRPVPGATSASSTVYTNSSSASAQTADAAGNILFTGLPPANPFTSQVCASSSGPGPGSEAGFVEGCAPAPAVVGGKASEATVRLGYSSGVSAYVYDATTGQPITGAQVLLMRLNPSGTSVGYTTPMTTINGYTTPPANSYFSSQTVIVLPQQPDPTAEYRVCATATGYAPACAEDDVSDGSSGATFSLQKSIDTLATIRMTPQ